MRQHALLTNTHLYVGKTENGKKRMTKHALTSHPATVADLYQLVASSDIGTVWIMPDCYAALRDDTFLVVPDGTWNMFVSRADPEDTHSQSLFARVRSSTGRDLYIGYPGRGRWGWTTQQPLDVIASAMYLEEELGVPCEWSPGHMGFSFLSEHYHSTDRLKSYIRESSTDLKQLPFRYSSRDVLWHLPFSCNNVGKWLHYYDKNSAYLSACQGVRVGCGEVVHHGEGEKVDFTLPGIYRVACVQASKSWPMNLPPIITTEWITSDVLQFAHRYGPVAEIVECYQFPEYHELFRKWAGGLWLSRANLSNAYHQYPYEPARQNANATIKEIACIGVGRFAGRMTTRTFVRPNWWADVVGAARVRMLYNLHRFYQAGNVPMLVYNDGVMFISENPDIATAVPGILDRKHSLGGYKDMYSVQITPEMIEASREVGTGKLLSLLHKTAGYREEIEL